MERIPYKLLSHHLDKLVRPELRLRHYVWPAYGACVLTGAVLGIIGAATLATFAGASPWVAGGGTFLVALACLGLAMATTVLTGYERYTFLHYQILVIVASIPLYWLLGQPILLYLDLTVLGLGIALTCGRIGCLMAGCCHGRPHPWGVCYRAEHAAAGFPSYLVGVRLLPIQGIESLWGGIIVLVGSIFILSGRSPGTALTWYIIAYGAGRFFLEFGRGDVGQSDFRGFSETQWTSLLLIGGVLWAEYAGVLPFYRWQVGVAAGLVLTLAAVSFGRRFGRTERHQLLQPHHIMEVAETINSVSGPVSNRAKLSHENLAPVPYGVAQNRASPAPANDLGGPAANGLANAMERTYETAVRVGCTSLGIQISAGRVDDAAGCVDHYTLSRQQGLLTEEAAKTVATLIRQLRHPSSASEFISGYSGVYHLLIFRPAAENGASTG